MQAQRDPQPATLREGGDVIRDALLSQSFALFPLFKRRIRSNQLRAECSGQRNIYRVVPFLLSRAQSAHKGEWLTFLSV